MTAPVNSYDPERLGRTFDEEIARLGAQVALSWTVEKRRLAALGIADGQRILEPGCGPGFVSERLAAWLPASRITAVDKDPKMLRVARRRLQDCDLDRRIEWIEAPVEATGLPGGVYDAVISRYLFQHLADPVAAAVEIRRLLRPGGIHVIIDIDDGLWGLAEPRFLEFEEWHHRRALDQKSRGGNRFLGRRLGRILREAGYARVELDVFATHSDDLGIEAFAAQLDPDQFLTLVDQGLLTVAEYARARLLYQKFCESPENFVLSVGFIAYAENPS